MRRIVIAALTVLLLAPVTVVAQTGQDLFQQALVKERADGDLRGAIAIYEQIVRRFAQDRALAAKALVQMGRCHEKLGNEDAQRAYRRVVQDYPDQSDMVAEARTRLSVLQGLAARPGPGGVVIRQLPEADGGSPSPDGRYLAHTDWTTGDIAIRDLSTGESRRLTTTGSQRKPIQFGMDPAFSPDGRYVAYEWHDSTSQSYYDLRIVPADGSGPPRVLYDTAGFYVMGPAWSHDGKHIAVARYPDDDSRTDLLWVSVDDGSARVLDSYAPSGYQGLSSSPDDRYVVYEVHSTADAARNDVHLAATDGSGGRAIVEHPADDRLLGWVPGTDCVLFLSNRSNVWGAWAVRVQDGSAQGEPRLVHPGMGQASPQGFTAAGDLYHGLSVRWFTTHVAPFDMETGRIDTAHAYALPRSTMTPEWSPDGTRLAYREEISDFQLHGYQRPLRVLDVTTRGVRAMAGHLTTSRPRWSPDGTSIVVSAYDDSVEGPNYHGGIYSVDVSTGVARLLRPLPSDPMWWMGTAGAISKDGASLFYLLQGVEGQGQEAPKDGLIVRRNLQSGTEDELFRDPDLLVGPFAISRDGHLLLFAVRGSTQNPGGFAENGDHLMLMDTHTQQIRELVQIVGAGKVESVTWSADGRYVLYPQSTGLVQDSLRGGTTIWRVPVDGGRPEQVMTFGFAGAVSPDGRWVAYTTGGIHTEHMVMENLKAVLQH